MGHEKQTEGIARERIEALLALIDKESRLGYGDSAVFGGFCRYLLRELSAAGLDGDGPAGSALLDLLVAYGRGSRWEREELLGKIRALVAALAKKEPASPPNKSGVDIDAKDSLRWLQHVGPKRQQLLGRLGIDSLRALLFYFPRRHEDRRETTAIGHLIPERLSTICGEVRKKEVRLIRKNLSLLRVEIADESGAITAVWFNQTYLKEQLHPGDQLFLYGRLELKYGHRQFIVSDFSFASSSTIGRILPVYGLSEGLNQKLMRQIVTTALATALQAVEDPLPQKQRAAWRLLPLREAIAGYHFPADLEQLAASRRRLVFDEFFLARLAMDLAIGEGRGGGVAHRADPEIEAEFRELLPFALTAAQNRAISEIYRDMEGTEQMNRLLEGDVGSGKTLVAAAAIYKAWRSRHQSALLAPTEILARQHFHTLEALFAALPLRLAFLRGATKAAARREVYRAAAEGAVDLLVGTHALLYDKTLFADLGLVVIDEQHRFGVRQREKMRGKGKNPDLLTLTATPIPRTLALTILSGQSLSVLDEMPPGRKPIVTMLVTKSEEEKVYGFIRRAVTAGRQAYIICQLIVESESLDLHAAEDLYRSLRHGVFRDLPIALLHGRLAPREKEDIMAAFYRNDLSVLVSTTVVEVGVDVPNATVMLVKDAQRFGLAQLHQVRGRIGRGGAQSYCMLEYDGGPAHRRLEVLRDHQDGFKIAEEDLKLRGPGDFFGVRQHGLPEMKIADLFIDHEVLAEASARAKALLAENRGLAGEEWAPLREILAKSYAVGV